jgi:hypothetical protein
MDEFIEEAVAERLQRRKDARADFIPRGLASLEEAGRMGVFVPAEEVIRGLEEKLEAARRRMEASTK